MYGNMAGKNNSVNNRQFIGIENLLTCFKLLYLRVYYRRNVSEKNVPKSPLFDFSVFPLQLSFKLQYNW